MTPEDREDRSTLIAGVATPSRDVAADTKSTSAVEDIGLRERLPVEIHDRPDPYVPEYVWVKLAAGHLPENALACVPAVEGQGPPPTQVTQKSILEDVLVLERAARKLRKFVTGISNRTVEMAPAPKEPRPIDEATRERARRALAKSGFVRVTK